MPFLAPLLLAAQVSIPKKIVDAADGVRAKRIEAHVRFLADDALEGRETGTRGYDVAAQYVAAQLASYGVEPAGDGGTFLQEIPFRSALVVPEESSFLIEDQPVRILNDVVLISNFASEVAEVRAPVVFVGFGITAPELGRDDYAGIDAKGKIVVTISGAPASFPTDQRAYYSSGNAKNENAAAHGAVGFIQVKSITDEPRQPFEKIAKQSAITSMRYVDEQGLVADVTPQLQGTAIIRREAARALFGKMAQPLDAILADAEKGITHSMPLGITVTMRTVTRHESKRSANVVGIIRGSDPQLRNERVAFSAHLDHLGNHPQPDGGDAIYNGALDNASGIATLLEVARVTAAMPVKPRRSIVFVACTGEEKGEQGSLWFARHAKDVVADINSDMFLMIFPVADLVPFGAEHSTLDAHVRAAVAAAEFAQSPDPTPEEVRFIRSDQYSFVRAGIPATILKGGSQSRDPKIDGPAMSRDWLRRVYHSPADEASQKLDWESGARYAKANLMLVWSVANAEERVRWKASDFFGGKFGR